MNPTASQACPECGAKVTVSFDDLLKKRHKTCANGHEFKVTDQAAGTARKVQKAADDLAKKLRRFGK